MSLTSRDAASRSPQGLSGERNAIAEAWWKMCEWFMGGEADIEDDGALIGQVSSRGYSIQSDRRIKLQPKEELAKSPDEADALAMTFAPTGGRARVRRIE